MRVIDWVAKWGITAGGLGVTVAFATIVVFIVSVIVPLFRAPDVRPASVVQLPLLAADVAEAPRIVALEVDEYLNSAWIIDETGQLRVFKVEDAQPVRAEQLGDGTVTAISVNRQVVALGLDDGTIQIGTVDANAPRYISRRNLPAELQEMAAGDTVAYGRGVGEMTPTRQLRVVEVGVDLSQPLELGDSTSPIVMVDFGIFLRSEAVVALSEEGRLYFSLIHKRMNLMLGREERDTETFELPVIEERAGERPFRLLMGQDGRNVYVIYRDGLCLRYNTSVPEKSVVVEQVDLLPDPNLELVSVRMHLGMQTLIVTDSAGGIQGWFPAGPGQPTPDGRRLVRAHVLEAQPARVTSVGPGMRDRQFVTADAEGNIFLRHMTSNQTQQRLRIDQPVVQAIIAPKNDALAVLDDLGRLHILSMHNPHADGSLPEMFLPVHYEGYAEPGFVYQSSAGTDAAEPKISLVPLIFGTIKATFYAMLFAVPIAIMAAIYSSEFMHHRVRSVVKPTVEMMASLPSVVLGFIGALVLAPFIENIVLAVLLVFFSIPAGLVAFGFLWQTLPPHLTRMVPAGVQFVMMVMLAVGAGMLAYQVGPYLEIWFFNGDMRSWLSGNVGTAWPGWTLVLLPLCVVAMTLLFNLYLKSRISVYGPGAARSKVAATELIRLAATAVAALGLALLAGWLLTAVGIDLRDSFFGAYSQRNTLIVGVVMGFAIIPIIYTVSEDALSSVPHSLRSASLGAGATPWQTAVRVVLPVAASGIFSACMIGFGRAAGETMIVLMVSGRTPLLDMNIFAGLSALSANIATELPEAAEGTTHYRMLFMSATVLFVMTFAVNTAAEIVRMRFRRRAFQL